MLEVEGLESWRLEFLLWGLGFRDWGLRSEFWLSSMGVFGFERVSLRSMKAWTGYQVICVQATSC